jgi:hypothetical protein
MKFSARNASRKWACGRPGCDQWPIAALVAAALAWSGPVSAAPMADTVPLPKSRPAEAPANEDKPSQKPTEADQTAGTKAPAPPAPSACRLALTENIAIAPSVPPITGPGGCGGDDLVRLEAVVLPDNKGRVAVKPAAVLRCSMASAIADWIRTDMAPLAEAQGSRLADLDNLDSYECRGRNGVAGAILSEHGRANALDVHALKLASGASITLTDRSVARDVRETVLHSVCTRFTTVLGPGSDGYHEDHIHLDLMQRHSGYRICQWEVWDPLPQVAPLLPAERPETAPPREVAEKADDKPAAAPVPVPVARPPEVAAAKQEDRSAEAPKPEPRTSEQLRSDQTKSGPAKSDQAKSDQAKSDQAKPDQAKPDQAKPDQAKPDQAKPDEAKPDEAKPDQAKSDHAKPDHAKPDHAKSDHAKPDHPRSTSKPKPHRRHRAPSFFSLFR